ncbi:putative Zinc finger, BED-type, partial [Corchorus olitorius]
MHACKSSPVISYLLFFNYFQLIITKGKNVTWIYKGPPSDDFGWKWGEAVDGQRSRVRCTFCDRVITGGITRFKEHLAAKKGNVAPCDQVSSHVRKEVAKQLKTFKETKVTKQKARDELEERIRLGDDGDYEANSDEDDYAGMSEAVYESLRSQADWEERQRQKALNPSQHASYEVGGSSSGPPRAELRRSSSVHTTSVGSGRRWSNPNTAATRLANMDPIIEKSKGDKQPKIGSSLLKKAKAKLGKAFAKLVLYEALPARVAESPFLQPTLQAVAEVGKGVRGPSAYEITNVYLNQEYNEIREW